MPAPPWCVQEPGGRQGSVDWPRDPSMADYYEPLHPMLPGLVRHVFEAEVVDLCIYTHTWMYVYIDICKYIDIYIYIYINIHTHIHTYIHICTYTCTYKSRLSTCVFIVSVCMRACMHACMHTCMHIPHMNIRIDTYRLVRVVCAHTHRCMYIPHTHTFIPPRACCLRTHT